MVQLQGPTAFYEVAQLVLDAVYASLEDSLGGLPERSCVVPGEIAWDACDCGLLAVSPRRWSLTDEFPEGGGFARGNVRATPCDQPWLVGELAIQLVRCAPSPQGGTLNVPCEQLDEAAQILVSDAYVALTATVETLCGLREVERIVDYVLGDQLTQGPAGGCVGTELTAFVALYR